MIEPFAIDVPAAELEELRQRLRGTRWPSGVTDSGGLPLPEAQRLVAHWADGFDWNAQQRRLNGYPQFLATIDDARVHFLRIVSPRADALPLLLLHGWPGSFVEFLGVVDRLRGDFHLVVPSLPGFCFSSPPMSNQRMADVLAKLMTLLGHEHFAVHGGDVGAGVATWLAVRYPERVVALHLNYIPGSYSPPADPPPSEEENEFLRRRAAWSEESGAYSHLQRTRPLTLAYGLTDSPAGLATWIAEKFREWADPTSAIPMDTLLTNITLYWSTNSIASSVRVYLESSLTPLHFAPGEHITVPTAVAHFPFELPTPPRSWVERVYDVRRWTEMPRGGHFAALEAPELLSADLVAFLSGVGT